MDLSEFIGSLAVNIGGVPPISQAYVDSDGGGHYNAHGPTGVHLLSATTADDAKDEASTYWLANGYKRISVWYQIDPWYCYVI